MNILGNQNGNNRLKDGYVSLGNLLATDSNRYNLTLMGTVGVDAIETVLGLLLEGTRGKEMMNKVWAIRLSDSGRLVHLEGLEVDGTS